MTTIDKLNIYSEVLDMSDKVFNFYKEFMILYGNDLCTKIDKNINVLHKLNSNFSYNGVLTIRKLSNNTSWDGTWVGFRSNNGIGYNAIYIRAEIYEKIAWFIEIDNDKKQSDFVFSMLKLLDFVNELINEKMNQINTLKNGN